MRTKLRSADTIAGQPRRDFFRMALGASALGWLGAGSHAAAGAAMPQPDRVELELRLAALEARDDPMFLVNRAETSLVHLLACLRRAKSILEVGTSHGYWTLWLALAARTNGGRVTTIEIKPERRKKAMDHLTQLELARGVTFLAGNAHELIPGLKGTFDLVVLNADKSGMMDYFSKLYPKKLKPGGLLLVYNYLTRRDDMKGYVEMIQRHEAFTSAVVGAIPDDAFLASLRV